MCGNPMTPGDKVMIYEDPIIQKKPEGKARLIELINRGIGEELWEVRFMDGFKCWRWIKVEGEDAR